MKFCNTCKQIKVLSAFNKRSDGPGHRSSCKECVNIKTREQRSKTGIRRKSAMSPEMRRSKSLESYKKFNAKPERKARQAFYEATRRAAKLNATPKWLTAEQLDHIAFYYEAARFFSILFGQQMEVDHIIPLKGRNVSGLHVPWNLQLMVKEANRAKNNKVEGLD